jgi:hypothetical protein
MYNKFYQERDTALALAMALEPKRINNAEN